MSAFRKITPAEYEYALSYAYLLYRHELESARHEKDTQRTLHVKVSIQAWLLLIASLALPLEYKQKFQNLMNEVDEMLTNLEKNYGKL